MNSYPNLRWYDIRGVTLAFTCTIVAGCVRTAAMDAPICEVGDIVVVVADPNDAKVWENGVVVDESWRGLDLRIEAVEGDRIWVNNGHPGWLESRHVATLDVAEKIFTEMIRQRPGDADLYNARGNVLALMTSFDDSQRDFDQAIRLSPKALYFRNRARARYRSGSGSNYASADADLDEAIRLSPTAENYVERATLSRPFRLRMDGPDDDFEIAIRLDPTYVPAYFNRGRRNAIFGGGGNLKLAEADFSEVIRLDSRHDQAYLRRAELRIINGEQQAAIDDFSSAIRLNRMNLRAYEQRAFQWMNTGDYEKSIADYTELIKFDRKNVHAYVERGRAYQKMADYAHAIADYSEAIALAPGLTLAYRRRGDCYALTGDLAESISDYSEGLRLSENSKDTESLNFFYNVLAWVYATCPIDKFRDGKKSLEFANKAHEISGGSPYDKDTLAAAYAEIGDFESAQTWQTRAIESAPEKKQDAYVSRLRLYELGRPFRDELKKSKFKN